MSDKPSSHSPEPPALGPFGNMTKNHVRLDVMQPVATKWLVQPKLPNDALLEIRRCAMTQRVKLTAHAQKRMRERNLVYRDIEHALSEAHRCAHAEEPDKWNVFGPSLDEDELKLVIVLEAGVLVVTIFGA